MAVLRLGGDDTGATYPVTEPICDLGRKPSCQIHTVFEGLTHISRRHARIEQREDGYFLLDLNSRLGTWLNGTQVRRPTRLKDGDRFAVGTVEFLFYVGEPAHRVAVGPEATDWALITDADESSDVKSSMNMDDSSFGETSLEAKTLNYLVDMLSGLGRTLTLPDVLSRILLTLFGRFEQADCGVIAVLGEGSVEVEPAAVLHRDPQRREPVRISRTLATRVLRDGEGILSRDISDDPRLCESDSFSGLLARSLICAPLLDSEGTALGIVQLETRDVSQQFHNKDLRLLMTISRFVSLAIQLSQLHGRVLAETVRRQHLEWDLDIARQIQENLLPRDKTQIQGYDLHHFYRAARQVGGDYYDYLNLPDGRLAVVVADAEGKGIAAAMFIAIVSGELKSALAANRTPSQALECVNRRLAAAQNEPRLATLILVVLDPASNEVQMVRAGHCLPVLRTQAGNKRSISADTGGLPLGVTEETVYPEYRFQLAPGDAIVLFSDGFTDAINDEEECFGLPRLIDCVPEPCTATATDMVRGIVSEVERFIGHRQQFDDMCLVCIQRR